MQEFWQKLNENHFSVVFVVIAGLLGWKAEEVQSTFAQIGAVKLANVGLLFTTFFGLLKFLRGTETDIIKEVFEENNTAAALLLSGLLISLAIAITVNS